MTETFEERNYDLWLVAIALIILVVSAVLILDDRILFSHQGLKSQIVAQVSERNNDVRRRMTTEVGFFPIKANDDVYKGDSIYTGSDSSSKIHFAKGGDISLQPDTMVVIESDGQSNGSLDIKKGNVEATLAATNPLQFKVGNQSSTLKADGAKVVLSKSASGAVSVNVEEGSVVLSGPNGKTVVGKDEVATLSQGEDVKVEKHFPNLLSPAPAAIIWVTQGEKPNFSWAHDQAQTEPYELQVARDSEFAHVVLKQKVSTQGATVKADAEGLPFRTKLYWRVKENGKSESLVRQVTFYHNDPPRILGPDAGTQYKAKELARKNIPFKWASSNGENKFEVQISSDSKFAKPDYDFEVVADQYTLKYLEPNTYYWRVRALDPLNPSPAWSAPRDFSITASAKLGAPEIPNRVINFQIPDSGK